MTAAHRVIWSQGMFLQPHHFQQQTRFIEQLLDARVNATHPFAWGFAELTIDESRLAEGQIALLRGRGVLPDGTAFSMPAGDALPVPLQVTADMQRERVVLALPRARADSTEVSFGDGQPDPLARFEAVTHELRDQAHAVDEAEPVQLGAPTLRLLRERDMTGAFAALGVVRVLSCSANRQVQLDRDYIAPQTRIAATGQLSAVANLLHGLVRQRAVALAGSMGGVGQGVSEVVEFLMLQMLNRCEPGLRQIAGGADWVHPRELHGALAQLAGELATFARTDRRPPEYPLYVHDDLQASFAPIVHDLREDLSAVLQRHAVQLKLIDRKHGVRTAAVEDTDLLHSAGFVLAVRSQLPPDHLLARFPTQSKLGPVDRIKELVNLQLPGIPIRSLPVAPRQLPYHAGSHYFELDRSGELWRQVENSGNLFVHVAGDFPGLELELWAIRAPS